MKELLSITSLMIASIFISSCSSDKAFESRLQKTLEKNPEIVFNAIKKNPEKFMNAFQKSVESAKESMAINSAKKEKEALEASFNSPLKPYISEKQLIRGSRSAPITIVEYSDFECPYCARGSKTIEQLKKKYPGKIRFVFKHLPLSFHPNAMISAKYYEAISLQSPKKAFEFHDIVFANQSKIKQGEAYLTQISKKLGVNMKRLKKDLNSNLVKNKIDQDIKEANKFSFQGTPGYLLNGIPIKGAYPASHFEKIIASLQERGSLKL